jgi:hypothetical protein
LKPTRFRTELEAMLEYGAEPGSGRGFSHAEIAAAPVQLPWALRMTYELAGGTDLWSHHNRLALPTALMRGEDGFVTFAEENQGVVLWGFRAGTTDDDPAVFQRQRTESGRLRRSWHPEDHGLSEFLISFGYWNLANGAAPSSCVGEASDATARGVAALPLRWRSPEFEVRGARVGAIVTADGDFYAFGRRSDEVSRLVKKLAPAWVDHESRPSAM